MVNVVKPVILFRESIMEESELRAAEKVFLTFRERAKIVKGDLVIGRYSVLPYFKELQNEVDYVGATLINSLKQHRYIADLRNWVEDLRELTPKTWYRLEEVDEPGPYVLKGKTNSRKDDWKTHMFAADIQAAGQVYWKLATDGLIGGEKQDIYVRKFVPLKTLLVGLNNLPVSVEFRFFCAFGEVICGAFYWSNYVDDLPEVPDVNQVPKAFLQEVLRRIGDRAPFVVVDVALTAAGEWIVVELNDGQMSGLSENDPNLLYEGLLKVLQDKGIA